VPDLSFLNAGTHCDIFFLSSPPPRYVLPPLFPSPWVVSGLKCVFFSNGTGGSYFSSSPDSVLLRERFVQLLLNLKLSRATLFTRSGGKPFPPLSFNKSLTRKVGKAHVDAQFSPPSPFLRGNSGPFFSSDVVFPFFRLARTTSASDRAGSVRSPLDKRGAVAPLSTVTFAFPPQLFNHFFLGRSMHERGSFPLRIGRLVGLLSSLFCR